MARRWPVMTDTKREDELKKIPAQRGRSDLPPGKWTFGSRSTSDGAGQFESVTLRPHAELAAGSDENIARRLHDAAAEKCFIARSVSFKVEHKPTFEIASA